MLEQVLALCERRGDPRAEGAFGIHLGMLEASEGDVAGGEARVLRSLRLVAGQMQILPWGHAVLARVYLTAGRATEARALARQVLSVLTESDMYVNHEAFVGNTLIECLLEDPAARHAAIGVAVQRLRRDLANIITPARRRRFLALPDCSSMIEVARQTGHMVDDLLAERDE